jgi:hypothetical protein
MRQVWLPRRIRGWVLPAYRVVWVVMLALRRPHRCCPCNVKVLGIAIATA